MCKKIIAIVKNKEFILLLLIILIAVFFRFWQLDKIPPGLYPDIAINGNEALDILQAGKIKVFYPENNGREGLIMWLIALSFLIFGPSVWAIKFVAAFFGTLTVLGLYFLTKEVLSQSKFATTLQHYNITTISLLSSFFLAISFWHTNFSRIGFRAILMPFILVFAFYFLFRGFRTQKIYNFLISGAFFGLGFYTYISYRFVIFLFGLALVFWFLIYKKQNLKKDFLKFTALCLLFTFFVALPLGIYFLKNPQDFIGRVKGVSIFSQGNPFLNFGKSLIVHFGMFNFHGDGNWRHNLAGSPQLLWPAGIMFLLGIIFSIKELIVSIKRKDGLQLALYGFLLGWFLFMLLPSFLSQEGTPHALRTLGVVPVVYIFVGIGAFWLFSKIRKFYKTKWQIIIFYFLCFIFLFAIGFNEFNKYFYLWGKNPETKNAFSANYLEIGNYLNSLPDNIQKFVIVNQSGVPVPFPNGIPMPAQTPIFMERIMYGKIRSTYVLPSEIEKVSAKKNMVIIPLRYDKNLFLRLQILFPAGKIINDDGVWVYKI